MTMTMTAKATTIMTRTIRAIRKGMARAGRVRGARFLLVALFPASAGACTDYILETTVNPDGSGVRVERVEVGDREDADISEADYRTLLHLTPADGWSRPTGGVNENGDSVQVIQRRIPVPDLASWSAISGTFRIDGALPSRAGERVGYVTLGNVRFRNEVRVGRGVTSDGATTFSYREVFTARDAVDALVEFVVSRVDHSLSRAHPRLTGEERGQIVGAFRARFWTAIGDGLLSCSGDCDDEEMIAEVARDVAGSGARIVAHRYPDAREEALADVIARAFEDEELEGFDDLLPGVNLSWNSHIAFRLRLPGEVISSNADRVEDGVLVWEFSPDAALQGPVEIRAESLLAR